MLNKSDKLKNWIKFSKINSYYYDSVRKLVESLIPRDASVLEFGSKRGELLNTIPNKNKVGIEFEIDFVSDKKYKTPIYLFHDIKSKLKGKKYDYILLSNTLSEILNIQDFLGEIKEFCHESTKVVVLHFNYFWKPFLDLGELLRLKSPENKQLNWLTPEDVNNFFELEGYQFVKRGNYFLAPYNIAYVSNFINKYLSPMPFFRNFSLINYSIYNMPFPRDNYSVSIVIPARNESGNMKGVIKKVPKIAKKQEIIFVEGHSTDDTYEVLKSEIDKYKGPYKIGLYKQKGKGKGDAVRLGFSKATGELLMILDADLTVDPRELGKFYDAFVQGKGDFIMGSRLVYPMENEAMRTLNIIGNKFFSILFSFLLDQRIKDTLCGTKVILRSDYEKIVKNRNIFGDFDPFGDFDLIFGAAKLNLKILEIPIRYKERTYGSTNISRFTHGWLLLKMVAFAFKKFKFI